MMWPRVVEVMVACWLAMSPFVFRYDDGLTLYVVNDLGCAAAIAALALLSCWRRFDKVHLLTLALAAWLIAVACLAAPSPPPPRLQNYVVTALLLLMLAIIPTRASAPPQAWLEFYAEKARRGGH